MIWNSPAEVAVARKWITSNNPTDPARVPFAGFSLRTGGDLAEFIDVIRGASRDLLSATAFALPATVLDALLGTSNDNYGLEMLRFYEHYRFRYYAKPLKLKQVRLLSTDDSWADGNYAEGSLKASSRLRFAGR